MPTTSSRPEASAAPGSRAPSPARGRPPVDSEPVPEPSFGRGPGPLAIGIVGVLLLLAITAFQLSSRLRNDLERELTERLRISAHLVTDALGRRAAEGRRNVGELDADVARELAAIREATSVSEIVLYGRDGGFLGGSVEGGVPGAVPRQIRLPDGEARDAPTGTEERAPERDPTGGLTLVVPLAPESGGGALLTRIDREGQGGLGGIDRLFTTAKVLAGLLFAAGFLILLRWMTRTGPESASAVTPVGAASDVDLVLGTMKEVMTTLKDSESDWRDRWSAAEADADKWRRTSDLILESIGSGIVAFDRSGRVTLFNRAAEEIFGFGPRHALGRDLGLVFGEEDRLCRVARHLLRTGTPSRRLEVERPGPDGESRWLGISSSPIRARDGEDIGGLLLVADLTETKRLRDGAALRDRLSAVGEMAASVAHEIKNCLHSMRGFENLLRDDLRGESPSMAVQGILSEAGSLEELVRGMLEFSRPSVLAREPCDLGRLLAEVRDSTAEVARTAGVEILLETPAEGPIAEIDPAALRGVFLNLAQNAVEAMEDGGTLTLAARATDTRDESGEGAVSGRFVRVSFRDTGPGIPEEDRARIFTPFWTTKRDGTGLGLALAHKTVTGHDGRIHLHSRAGVGTEFVLLLPREAP